MKQSAADAWKDLAFGMFIHYGLYSIPAGVWKGKRITRGYSEQILSHGYLPQGDYEALQGQFTALHFDADSIAERAKEAGMKYLVITAKHHDGFCLFDTATTRYSSVHSPCHRDLVKELSDACVRQGLAFGIYFSWIDWHIPEASPISPHNSDAITEEHQRVNLAQLTELLSKYGRICELWMDMGAPTREQSEEVRSLVRRLQSDCMINGRIWNDCQDFLTMGDNEIPEVSLDVPWQTPASIYHETWGYRSWQVRTDAKQKAEELIASARKVIGNGGNYLLNVGLTGDGAIQLFEQEVLELIGDGLSHRPPERMPKSEPVPEPFPSRGEFISTSAKRLYRYTGEDYYTYRPVVTGLVWYVQLERPARLSFFWHSREALETEEKLVLSVDGTQYIFSRQRSRTEDGIVSDVSLSTGTHQFSLHTVGEALVRPALTDPDVLLVVRKEEEDDD